MALGQVAGGSPDATGLDHLLRFCQARLFDAALGMPASWQFADLAEHYLTQVFFPACSLIATLMVVTSYVAVRPVVEHTLDLPIWVRIQPI